MKIVAPVVAEAQANLHEDIVSAVGALEDTMDSFKSLGKTIPEGTDMYKCINLINFNLKAARSLAVSTNCAAGTADIITKNPPSSVPLLLVSIFFSLNLKGGKLQLLYQLILKRIPVRNLLKRK